MWRSQKTYIYEPLFVVFYKHHLFVTGGGWGVI
jgi:hypothetical protein